MELLSRCNNCPAGQNSLKFTEEAHALSCNCLCTNCGKEYNWSNSPVLHTANASPMEKLKQVNLDMVVASSVTAVGTSVSTSKYLFSLPTGTGEIWWSHTSSKCLTVLKTLKWGLQTGRVGRAEGQDEHAHENRRVT